MSEAARRARHRMMSAKLDPIVEAYATHHQITFNEMVMRINDEVRVPVASYRGIRVLRDALNKEKRTPLTSEQEPVE